MVLPNAFILIPLYIYPVLDSGASAWTFLTNTIRANPNVLFEIIINPSNGPGDVGSNGCSTDPNYNSGMASLNAFENTNLLGYVHTGWALDPPDPRPIGDVFDDISTWNGISLCPTADTHIDGIFFDEAPADFTTASSTYMQQITTFARTSDSPFFPIIFNPGTTADTRFFAYPDNIVMLEDIGSNSYDITGAIADIPVAERRNSSILFNEWNGLTESKQATVVQQVREGGVSGFFITTEGYDGTGSDVLWPDFVAAMNPSIASG